MVSSRTSPSDGGTAGAFKCDQPGCKKTFTRKDHLIRHQANHSNTTYTCSVCNRAFKRLDLLQRHEKRNICGEAGPSRRSSKRARSSSSAEYSPAKRNVDVQPDSIFDGWTPDVLGAEDWLPRPADSLAGPHNESSLPVDLPWNVLMRTKESAARGQEAVVSPGLAARLQAVYRGYDLSLATDYLQLYWTEIAPSYPFIHRGTFDVESAPLNIVMLMLITGSSRSANRQDFSPLVSLIRAQIFASFGTSSVVPLQSLALCHVYDTWYGKPETLSIAQCMWATVVAHGRRIGIDQPGVQSGDGEEEVWANWIRGEERRRAAYAVLMLDTQISAFWNQPPSRQLPIFAHDLPLPSSRAEWEAPTASDWLRARIAAAPPGSQKHAPLAPSLHTQADMSDNYGPAILSALASQPETCLTVDQDNAFTVQMVVLGVMATAWDNRMKGGMGLRLKEGTKPWRKLTQDALIHLRATWEEVTQHATASVEIRDLRDTFGISILSVLSDIPMLLIVANASTICGTPLSAKYRDDAKSRCKLWVKTDDAFTCLWQSARYLKQALFADWGIYTPWAVFTTTLVLYAYSTAVGAPHAIYQPSSATAETTNALLDSILTSNARPVLADGPLLDLLACVAEKLEGREDIDRANAETLRRLVAGHSGANGSEDANGHAIVVTPLAGNGEASVNGVFASGPISSLRSSTRGLDRVDSTASLR